jgi:RNA polymerase sigma-70 factor (ECF subfamily)
MQDLAVQALVESCIKGKRGAWDKFVEQFSAVVFWAIKEKLKRTNYCYSQQDVEDIFQNVFILLWEKKKLIQIRYRENIKNWLIMVAANCTINYFRGKRKRFSEVELLSQSAYSADCNMSNTEDQERLQQILEYILSDLPKRELIILKLSYLHNKTHQEISQILKMPQNTISSIIKRTKEKLKVRLQKDGWKNF